MNRRQLFLSTAKAALLTSFSGAWWSGGAKAQTPAPGGTPPLPPPAGPQLYGVQPNTTRTITGDVLPPPALPFGGEINLNAAQSTPWWPPTVVPPEGAPNILLIMTDDVGFAAPSTFGGVIPTPALDRVAANGLRYTNFHSTSLCSPTRAALITGRNHHSAGYGVVTEMSTGFPGYNSVIGVDNATIGRILLEHGYRTSWFGKDHNTPDWTASQAGPFDQWPTGMGFEYFYGFVGGDTSQWQPNLFRNTTPIYPYVGNPEWNLTTAMADDAIHWLNQLNDINPSMKFFLHYVPGGTHSPHHPTPEWIKKITDMHLFDQGWNALRDQIFANQKRLGVVPQDARLTPWPDDLLKTWDKLTDVEKKLFIRQANVYAAYLAYTDQEIGRVIQAVEDLGKLDDTLIIYISGDNGASAEGSPNGTPSEVLQFNGIELTAEQQMPFYDAWGTDATYPHFAVPWSWAFDTPYKWMKQIPSFFGGTRQGMAVSWPARIKDKGGVRNQFHHVIDIVPTLLECIGIRAPDMVDGIAQKPIEGVSMAYTFDKANAAAPSRRETQYFEMMGVHGLYHNGWMLSAVPVTGDHHHESRQCVQNGALRHPQRLDTIRQRRRPVSRKAQGYAGADVGRVRQIPGSAIGCVCGDSVGGTTSQCYRRQKGVCLFGRDRDRHPARRCAKPAQHLVYDHRRNHGSEGWSRWHDPHQWRALRRLRPVSGERQAGVPVEPARRGAGSLGSVGAPGTRQAHARIRFQI